MTLTRLLRTPASAVWLMLTLATVLSWALGGHHVPGTSHNHAVAAMSILLIAAVKIRFVGLYFMDLRGAPKGLRIAFEGYCFALWGAMSVLYLHT